MPPPFVATTQILCSFGTGPSVYNVLPTAKVMIENKPAATIMDNVPMMNIMPFPTCIAPTNPSGMAKPVPAPGPCVPVILGPWTPSAPKTLIGNKPALVQGSTCVCTWGGIIQMVVPAAMKTMMS